ncbi:TSUP family transporter [Nannocystaceae bacterium ST9]
MHAGDLMVLVLLGLAAGAVTTLSGLGGGLVVVVAAAWFGPHAALALTAPALAISHLHRAWLLRSRLDRRIVVPFALAIAPVAFVGSLITARLDADALRWLLVVALAIAVLDAFGLIGRRGDREREVADRRWLIPGGAGVGLMMASGGGAGVLAAPVLRTVGVRGDAMVASLAVGALIGHVARTLAYGRASLLGVESLAAALALTIALIGGNLLGRRMSARIGEPARERMLHAMVFASLALAIYEAL